MSASDQEPGVWSPAECRRRAEELMRLSEETSDPKEKAELLREAMSWLLRATRPH